MSEKLTPAQEREIKRVCAENNLPYDKWNIDWAHIYDPDTGKKVHTLQFVNDKVVDNLKERVDRHIARMAEHAPAYKPIRYKKVTDPHLKLIDVADLHVGKVAHTRAGKVCYDIDKAVHLAELGVETLLTRSQGFPTETYLFPIGNDVVHVDSKENTTTRGTRQDTDGMWHEMVEASVMMYVRLLEELLKEAPVHVVYNQSNHDNHTGYMVAREVRAWMHKHKHLHFTISQNDREYVRYHQNMIGLDHGDGAKIADIPQIMAAEEPKMWGETLHRYMVRHHLHHWQKRQPLIGKDFPGVTINYMRSLSRSDDWHRKMGYIGAPQAIDAFIYHPDFGQVDHMSCVFSKLEA